MPFIHGISNFKLFIIKDHEKSGTHNVSVALGQSSGLVTSMVRSLWANVQKGIMALFRAMYRTMQRSAPKFGEGAALITTLENPVALATNSDKIANKMTKKHAQIHHQAVPTEQCTQFSSNLHP